MSLWERLQSVLVAASAVAGTLAGLALPIGEAAGHVVLPALLLMLTGVFVQVDATSLGEARRAHTVVAASLVLNFVWTPLLAWALGTVLLGHNPDLRIGLLLLLVTPCTDWYLVFTGLARGHMGVAAALLPINLVLQLMLLPLYVMLLGGPVTSIALGTIVQAVLLVLLVPLAAAVLLRSASSRWAGAGLRERVLDPVASASAVPLLLVAVFAMFAWQARTVVEHALAVVTLLGPLAVFFVVMPAVSTATGRALRLPRSQRVTLTMSTVARNSPIALALAVAAFPGRPLIAVSLAVAPLIELPVLALISQLVRGRSDAPAG
ncbi:Arsenite efflux pump ArsB, ACR3 family [Haloechinothrix alba]|uniref:Arsenite efflux pump ArsB, ACR3 family n=1 Tax=Haloechinothrix alba TaxID=664784 RepID=A0A238ZS23_9PSEU|nr:arsenic resistance protein [Haloechinothrix alba]SNR85748.1 Arsenite efflux pump ArsB, ACR3 family [Haloechinothrix alba]